MRSQWHLGLAPTVRLKHLSMAPNMNRKGAAMSKGIENRMQAGWTQSQGTLDDETASGTAIVPRAVIGGLLAAAAGGGIWGLIVHLTGYEVVFVAWGIGALCGYGVLLATGMRRGRPMQIVSSFCSLLGILLGKYFAYYAVVRQLLIDEHGSRAAGSVSLLMPELMESFAEDIEYMFQGMDVLFIIMAIGTAWVLTSRKNEKKPGNRPDDSMIYGGNTR